MKYLSLTAVATIALAGAAHGQSAPPPDSDAAPPATTYRRIGVITPRSSADLAAAGIASPFSVGAEQTDRGYSTYSKWASYLPWLGVPAARVQTGWADVEKTQGNYDFTKLDQIYDGMTADSVKPWFDLMYGNPIYANGGTSSASSPLPADGTPARTAWLAFVSATVTHFSTGGRLVTEWEIWNEPSTDRGISAAAFATFAAQTAQAIKQAQPSAKILLGGFAGVEPAYVNGVVTNFAGEKGATVPNADVQVTFHPYDPNPDGTYREDFSNLRGVVAAKGFTLRQGENGAPSVNQNRAALANLPWTETRQAKWDVRRLLGDFYRGLRSSVFTITDTHIVADKYVNSKGLLLTVGGTTPGDQTVSRPKVAYGAIRGLTAIFDSRMQPVTTAGCTAPSGYVVHAYTRLDAGNIRRNALVVWRMTPPAGSATTPVDASTADITVTCTAFQFPRFASNAVLRPRYTDLIAAKVYELLNANTVVQSGSGVTVTGLRVYDSPVILADQGIVPITAN